MPSQTPKFSKISDFYIYAQPDQIMRFEKTKSSLLHRMESIVTIYYITKVFLMFLARRRRKILIFYSSKRWFLLEKMIIVGSILKIFACGATLYMPSQTPKFSKCSEIYIYAQFIYMPSRYCSDILWCFHCIFNRISLNFKVGICGGQDRDDITPPNVEF